MLDVHRLRLLRELAMRGTIAAVAEALSYSPSAVSQQLSVLEREVGTPLLERVGRGVRLTAPAQVLVGHADAILARLERAEADVAATLTEVTGTLRVATFQSAALTLVPRALARLRERHPALRIEVTGMEPEIALPALLARDLDLVVAEDYPDRPAPRPPELQQEDLCRDEMLLVLPTGTRITRLADLAEHPWVMESVGTVARSWSTALCRAAGFEPDVAHTSTDLLVQAALVRAGQAAAFIPALVPAEFTPDVVRLPIPDARQHRRIFTAVRAGSDGHPAVTATRRALHDAAPPTNGSSAGP
ncbi:LysR family transcriptional regulator [Polymorphospora rubra]|uniref:LysR family transcriptional regulator n=1 Tax=Polymorphospora rubra TaxID=338584 RepID=UPI0033DF8183